MNSDEIRSAFPGVAAARTRGESLLDNAGGSQVPRAVADAMRNYMLDTYVQLGADYETSRKSSAVVEDAHRFIATFMNAGDAGKVALGPSTSTLCFALADAYARAHATSGPGARNEIVIAQSNHEANAGPWARLAERGFSIRIWPVNKDTGACEPDDLAPLLSSKTRLVTFPHVSNILGRIEPIERITKMAHDAGARVVADGVAFAPHRAIDVARSGVDWYVYSTYKVYGPHMAAIFGTRDAFDEIEGPNHYFVDPEDHVYKFELGGVSHEGCAGLCALSDYLGSLTGADGRTRETIEAVFNAMTEFEAPLQRRLLDYLRSRDDITLIGPATGDPAQRVATISFTHATKSSKQIALAANAAGHGLRYGHFYAHRLCKALGMNPDDGVVRTSLVHYNTAEEVERLIRFFEEAL